jgi:hypothetical protein
MEREIRLGESISLDDGNYMLVDIGPDSVGLINRDTGAGRTMLVAELYRRLSGMPAADDSLTMLELAASSTARKALIRAQHIEEVLFGTPLPGKKSRAVYSDARSLSDRVNSKAEELGVAPSTVWRWMHGYRNFGLAGVVDKSRVRHPFGRVEPDVVELAEDIVLDSVTKAKKPFAVFKEDLELGYAKRYPGKTLPEYSYSTLRRLEAWVDPERRLASPTPRKRSHANVPVGPFAPRLGLMPGAEAQVDIYKIDVLLLTDEGRKRRFDLAVLIDRCCEFVYAFTLVDQGTNSFDLALLLADASVPPWEKPQGWMDSAVLASLALPWLTVLNDEEQARNIERQPFCSFDRILCDNGSQFTSRHFRDILEYLEKTIEFAAVYSPTDKGRIERFFKSLKDGVLSRIGGFVGGSIAERGSHPEHDPGILTVQQFAFVFEMWLVHVWNNLPLDGLRDRDQFPRVNYTPASLFAAYRPLIGGVTRQLDLGHWIAFLPSQGRTIQNYGIEINSRRYDSPLLVPLRYRQCPYGPYDGKWPVHYHPTLFYDAVWVMDPESNEWIECRLTAINTRQAPFWSDAHRDGIAWVEEYGHLDDTKKSHATREIINYALAGIAPGESVSADHAKAHDSLARLEASPLFDQATSEPSPEVLELTREFEDVPVVDPTQLEF